MLVSLPQVTVHAALGDAPTVTVDGTPVAGVQSAQITVGRGGIPQVSLVLHAATVSLELPAGVTVIKAGPSAAQFADQLDPRRLEHDALEVIEAATTGEAFTAAVRAQAADFDDRG